MKWAYKRWRVGIILNYKKKSGCQFKQTSSPKGNDRSPESNVPRSICPKTLCSLSPTPMMLHIKFDQDWPTGFRDSQVQKCEIFVTQGQVTPKWEVWFGPKSNSTELLCLSWLPATFLMMIWLKNERASMETAFSHYKSMEFFLDAQGQLTPMSVVRSGRNSNSSETLCMSSFPASIKRIGSKATEKRWRQHFPNFKSMGAFCCHGHQSFGPICLKTLCSLSPPLVMLHIKFDQHWPIGLKDIQVRKCKIFVIQRQIQVSSLIWPEIKLVQAFMPVLVSRTFDDDSIKNESGDAKGHLPMYLTEFV